MLLNQIRRRLDQVNIVDTTSADTSMGCEDTVIYEGDAPLIPITTLVAPCPFRHVESYESNPNRQLFHINMHTELR